MFGHSIYGPIGIVIAEVFFTLPSRDHHPHHLAVHRRRAAVRGGGGAAREPAADLPHLHPSPLPACRLTGSSAPPSWCSRCPSPTSVLRKSSAGTSTCSPPTSTSRSSDSRTSRWGAVVSVVLLIPAVLAFAVDRVVQRRQVALLSSRAGGAGAKPNRTFDAVMLGYCILVSVFLIGMLGTCQYAALVKFYPYDLSFGLQNYDFDVMDWRRLGRVLELDSPRDLDRHLRDRRGLRRCVPGGEGPRLPGRSYRVPAPRDDADGGSRAGPGARLHLLLQPPGQPARVPLPHDGDPGDQHHRPLLHRRPPDRGDRAQADGPRVRVGRGPRSRRRSTRRSGG